jgi:gliding motility-associated-like protein
VQLLSEKASFKVTESGTAKNILFYLKSLICLTRYTLILGIFFNTQVFSQSIIINEVSQGTSGSQEYVEFLVTGPALVNCNDVPPCLDLRLWVFDDNNGYLNGEATTGVGIASGAVRFADIPFWSCIPVGTIIVIYNDGDLNPDVPAPDTDMDDGNCTLSIPISSTLFDRHTTLPSSTNPNYSGTGWVSGGSWNPISMANGQDGFQIYNPNNFTTPVFSIGWGAANTLGDIWMGASTSAGDVFFATDCDYYNQASWVEGPASSMQTPGAPNNAAQADCIGLMNANCNPPVVTITSTPATCGNCDGTATATITGGTSPFQLTWTPAPPVGQGTTTISGLCAGGYELLLVDDNGTGCSLVTPVTISASGDAIPPTASNPDPINVQCIGDVPAPDPAVVTDAADNGAPPVVTWEDDTSDGFTCPQVITRRYRVTDDCGNFIFVSQTITVDDTQAPAIAGTLTPLNIEGCSLASATAAVTTVAALEAMGVAISDNCTTDANLIVTSTQTNTGTCPIVITRIYTITDACGNASTVTQTITVDDTQAPAIAGTLTPLNIEGCSLASATAAVTTVAALEAMGVAISDNCTADANLIVTSTQTNTGTCPIVITRIYTITDACGNASTVTQTITVDDTQAPAIAGTLTPLNIEGCSLASATAAVTTVAALEAMGVAISDNCTADANLIVTSTQTNTGTCPIVITRIYTITDACGNASTVTQIITVDDNINPTASNPADINVTDPSLIPLPDPTVVIDEADNCTVNPLVEWVSDVSDNGNCPEIITRTYSITDDCLNQITVVQLIYVGDAIIPTASNPDPITVQCISDVPAPDPAVVTDAADNGAPPVVTWEDDTSDGFTCPQVITRRYRVTDDCGNFIFVTQIITIDDTTDPTATAPLAASFDCIADVPAASAADITDAADNCTVAPLVVYNGETTVGTCPMTITRTWDISDDCGNTITVTQVITVDDNIAPTATAPLAATYDCIADVPAASAADITDAADNCTVAPLVVYNGDTTVGTCPMTITRTWDISDDCGNTITVTQVITVDDNIAPTATAPLAVSFDCIADVPAASAADITDAADNCTVAPIVVYNGETTVGTCPMTITRTWDITDDCGNVTTVTQIITVDDNIAPTATAPLAASFDCIADVPAASAADITDAADNCTVAPTVVYNGETTVGTCPMTITRTWDITDDCGNVTTVTQIITVDDNIDPTASNPADIVVPGGTVPAPDPAVVIDEADNCTLNPLVEWVSDVSDNGACPETITRTYSVTDDCGNQITVTQLILITDPFPPTASNPDPINVQCIGDVPVPNPAVVTDAADNGAPPVVTWEDDTSNGLTCPQVITRRYRVTDDCGNFIFVTQIISVNDDTPPTASTPAPLSVECITDVPPANPEVVIDEADNCGVPTVAFVSESSDGNVCAGEIIIRTYSVTDSCGNSITVTHTITVDSYTPSFTVAGTDPTVCGGTDGFITISGLLANTEYSFEYGGNTAITITTNGAGEYVIIGLGAGSYSGFTVSDADCPACSTTNGATITLTDPTPPTVDAGIDQTVCEGSTVILTATNPDGAIITWNNGVADGASFTPAVGTTTYTVTANLAGCINTDQVNVTANPLPTIDAGVDQVVCDGTSVILTAMNPDGAIITWDNGILDGTAFSPGAGTTTYTVTADLAGCINTDQVAVTTNPIPVFTLLSTNPTQCGATDGTITISGLSPGTNYTVSYNGGAASLFAADGAGNIVLTGFSAGGYVGFQVTLNGCSTTDGATITLTDPNAPPIDAGPNQTVCDGTAVTLTATNPSGATITWNNGVTNGVAFNSPLGTVQYVVTANLNNCISTDVVSITVNPIPNVDAGPDQVICEGESITLNASGANSYAWNNGVTNGVSFIPTQSGVYTVVGTSNGCPASDDLNVIVNPISNVSFNTNDLTGCAPAEFTLTNTSDIEGEGCVWTLGNGVTLYGCDNVTAYFTSAGCFDVTLTITTIGGCTSSATYEDYICIENDPIANFSADPLIVNMTNSEVNFINGSFGAVDYDWDFGDGAISNAENPSHTFDNSEEGNYTVQLIAYSSFGCSDTAYAIVQVQEDLIFYVPNTFTPDGDAYNELFLPIFTSGFDPDDYNLLIFNRWGEVLFESNNSNFGWDGTYGGKIVKDGTYVWKIEFKTKYTDERQVHVGHVNVLR